jgi:sugar phosphate isomerase/epimerase
MRLGIFAKTFPGTTPESVLTQVAEAGYAATQYNLACSGLPSMPDSVGEGLSEAVRDAAHQARVELVALSGTFNMIHPDPAVRAAGMRSLAAVIGAAARMGAPLVTLCTGTRDAHDQWRAHPDNGTPEAWRDLLQSMEEALVLAEAAGIDLGVEPELANVVSSAKTARHLIDVLQSARVKIVFDAANLFEREGSSERRFIIDRALDTLADRIVMAHAKDRNADGSFATAGKGVIDYPHYIRALRDVRFTGPLVTHGLAAEEAAGVAQFLRRILDETA